MKEQKTGIFSRMFWHNLRMQLEEIKHKHNLEIQEMKAAVAREKKLWEEDKNRLIHKLTEESDLKLKEVTILAKLDYEQRLKQVEINAERKTNERIADLNKQHYDKLSDSMTKLHEEGNRTTKFTEELALRMMGSMPANKSEMKVLTGKIEIDK